MDKALQDTIEKIKTLATIDAEFASEMRNLFGKTDSASSVSDTYTDNPIEEIYEYCIEKIIKEQATQFYKDFPVKEIVPGLIDDFIRMEFFYRRNSFEEFSMALYQQIERITNYVCQIPKFNESYEKLIGHPAYVKSVQQNDGTWSVATISDRNTTSQYQIAHLLFGREKACEKSLSTLSALWAMDKVSSVLYFLCYKAKLKSQEFVQFTTYKNYICDIYQIRNLNHRGSSPSENQKIIIDSIRPQQGVYYFKFMQTLLFYVEGVTLGLNELDTIYNYAMSQVKRNVIPLVAPKILGKIELPEDAKKRF